MSPESAESDIFELHTDDVVVSPLFLSSLLPERILNSTLRFSSPFSFPSLNRNLVSIF